MNCTDCGKASGNYRLCFKCQLKAARKEGFNLGYSQGVLAGEQSKGFQLDLSKWRQLVQLCHPDKHRGSPREKTAEEISVWLTQIKPD